MRTRYIITPLNLIVINIRDEIMHDVTLLSSPLTFFSLSVSAQPVFLSLTAYTGIPKMPLMLATGSKLYILKVAIKYMTM